MKTLCALTGLLAVTLGLARGATVPELHGDLAAHDPSTVVQCNSNYWLYTTGWGVRSLRSKDLRDWQSGPPVFTRPPAWTTNAVPGNRGYFWAPDVIFSHGRYLLYYSVSTWGSPLSAIGLASSKSLDPEDKNYGWTDHGPVLQSNRKDDFNAIDPGLFADRDGKLWMVLGSFWSGIKLVELDPVSGLRLSTNSPITALAWNREIEAAALTRHGDFYYLFVNWGLCCRRTNSTYQIVVGRSRTPTGPYLDFDGRSMMQGGGTLVLATQDTRVGPGHAGLFAQDGTNWLTYHFYDATNRGRSRLGLQQFTWTREGWPSVQ